MAGGLFAMDREYFNKLGRYDEGMDIWGGENLEMSFRIWMCGGTLEIVTCSHVGHVFRKSTPYTFPGGTSNIVNHNNARLAEVWMDEWKDFFFAINPAAKNIDMGDTTKRKQLRKDLQCRDFRWYLENIYPESQMPLNYYSLGEIRNVATKKCLDTFGRKSGENIALSPCHGLGGNQVFAYTKREQIMSDDNCMDASNLNSPIKLIRCHGMGGNQAWLYNNSTKQIIHKKSGHCLENEEKDADNTSNNNSPRLRKCNLKKRGQKWLMVSNFKWQSKKNVDKNETNQDDQDESNEI
ncbi:hypothetical protein BLA29_005968 [Euroglyphus maynei]|uniref:polypeptide N-acetylgalactosaminyltransferase n=1 Tax=Euroglyphus maynei TaxID=6958 RepID=A0A1Y3AYZ8_EURMA|nr:hypothetical protein BLA29_005968 [Euroglyphus maynei]